MLLTLKISIVALCFILTGGNFFNKYIDEVIENNKVALFVKTLSFIVAFLGSIYLINDVVHSFKEDLIKEIKEERGEPSAKTTENKNTTFISAPISIKEVIGKYIIYSNGTVKDTKNKLIWKRCAEGLRGNNCQQGQAKKMSYQAALDYADKIEGWRMPTIQELNTLVYCSNGVERKFYRKDYWATIDCRGKDHKDNAYQQPTINQQVFPNTPPKTKNNDVRSYYYGSSSSDTDYSNDVWGVNFLLGNDSSNVKRSSELFVRLVRE